MIRFILIIVAFGATLINVKCPDCGAALAEMRIDSSHFVYRCSRCGGVLGDSETVNVIDARHLAGWRRVGVDPRWLTGGADKCPICTSRLQPYHNEEVPANLPVKRCMRCGKWWFSGDGLFRYKEAQEVKINYFRMWFGSPNVPKLLLPVAMTAMVVLAMGIGVNMVQERQGVSIAADAGITAFSATNLTSGEAIVSFRTLRKDVKIEYSESGKGMWKLVKPEFNNGVYTARLSQLVRGVWYEVRISGAVFEFQAE